MRTAYFEMIDEAALAEVLDIRRVPMEQAEDIPNGEVVGGLICRVNDGCAVVQAKGSAAVYEALAGLQEVMWREGGNAHGGMQYLPIAAFHERLYPLIAARLKLDLEGYDHIAARVFERGNAQKPIASVGNFLVEVHDGEAGYGHLGSDVVTWAIVDALDN